LANSAKTAKSGEPLVHRRGDGPLTISVKGSVSRPNDPKNPLSIPVTDPGVFFATTFKTVLAAKGIRVHGEVVRRRLRTDGRLVPAKCEIVALHQSKLEDFLWRVNKSSQNMFAEALVKTIGAYGVNAAMPRTGSAKSGAEMIGLWLESLGLTPDAFTIDDGSGLSHDNRLTPRAVSSVLVHMDTHPKRAVYRESLAVPGEQVGTLRRRLRSLDDQVRAKTGYIRGVSALSGYVTAAGGERYAFTMLCNDIGRHKGTGAKTLQNRLCELLAQ
jgi:D-alanyl-D-alanine carboxypeptidase/D-alanyl-D-alanine-endopeptidase (penicillin-binding protein 4)